MSRNLNFCFTKMKSPLSPEHNLRPNHGRSFSDTDPAASASSSHIFKNFNSLYDNFNAASASSDSDSDASAPDIATVFASRRFFFSSPGRSNSIIDSSSSIASTSSSASLGQSDAFCGGATVAVPTYSPDPFMDFRRSMQEMVEARGIHDVQENWEYLHELLMCYLSLNPKSTHKFIVGAFADLLVALMTAAAPENSLRRKTTFPAGNRKISRRCVSN